MGVLYPLRTRHIWIREGITPNARVWSNGVRTSAYSRPRSEFGKYNFPQSQCETILHL
jgi:hypothetical protein